MTVSLRKPEEKSGVSLCVCCALKNENDDTSDCDYCCEGTHKPMGKLDADPSVVRVVIIDSESHFSHYPCDGCGSRLAGERLDAVAYLAPYVER